jgi:hypothetical protein
MNLVCSSIFGQHRTIQALILKEDGNQRLATNMANIAKSNNHRTLSFFLKVF